MHDHLQGGKEAKANCGEACAMADYGALANMAVYGIGEGGVLQRACMYVMY